MTDQLPPDLTESASVGVMLGATEFERKFASPYVAVWEVTRNDGRRDYMALKSKRQVSPERERDLLLAVLMCAGAIPPLSEDHPAHSMTLPELRETLRAAFYPA